MSQRSPRSYISAARRDQQACGLGSRRHVGELQLDRLMLRDRFAEGLANLRVTQRFIQRRLRDADAARRHVDAAKLQPRQSVLQPAAFDAADQPVHRHAVVLEHQLGTVDSLVAEFLQLATDGETGGLLRQQHAHAAMARFGGGIGLHQQREAGTVDAVADPRLGAVHHIGIALAARGHADRLEIGAAIRLGQRQTAAQLARGETWQELALLRVGAVALRRSPT